MSASSSSYGPAGSWRVFPLLELLERLPGVFTENLLAALEPHHKAALALTCSALRDIVQQATRRLVLRTGSCCLSRVHALSAQLPNVSSLLLQPGNLHEAMFVVPLFLMQDGRHMRGVTSLDLHDLLPDRPPEEVQCASCTAWASTYDLSAILATAAACLPGLRALTFSTHYISEAECAAIGLMSGLTRLQLRSTHGTHAGGLAHLGLTRLAELRAADRHHSSVGSPRDLAALLGASRLTALDLGHAALLGPLLGCLAEMHSEEWQAQLAPPAPAAAPAAGGTPAAAGAVARDQQHQQASHAGGSAAGAAGGLPAPAASSLAAAAARSGLPNSSELAGGGAAGAPAGRLLAPTPPPLVSLSLVVSPALAGARLASAFTALAALTGLTALSVGWGGGLHQPGGEPRRGPDLALELQQQLSSLGRLARLGLGWWVQPQVLGALAFLTALTELQLGGLFSACAPPVPEVGQLRLPAVRRLTVQLETPPPLEGWGLGGSAEPLAGAGCVDALAAFPGLTRLELCGRLYGDALARLPHVLPAATLAELLLPQRLARVRSHHLAALAALQGLTHLRLGWRSCCHLGPAGYAPQRWSDQPMRQQPRLSLAALTQLVPQRQQQQQQQQQQQASCSQGGDDEGAGRRSAAAAGGAAVPLPGSPPLGRLRSLEVVGPLPPSELAHLAGGGLPGLRRLVLRDNISWASGRPPADLLQLVLGRHAARPGGSLTRLELLHCPGVDATALEADITRHLAATPSRRPEVQQPAADAAQQPAGSARACRAAPMERLAYAGPELVVAARGGCSAAELGRGYGFMGCLLSPAEEYGLAQDEAAGFVATMEQLAARGDDEIDGEDGDEDGGGGDGGGEQGEEQQDGGEDWEGDGDDGGMVDVDAQWMPAGWQGPLLPPPGHQLQQPGGEGDELQPLQAAHQHLNQLLHDMHAMGQLHMQLLQDHMQQHQQQQQQQPGQQ